MKKFKKGDKVRVISAGWGVSGLDLGKTTTITSDEGAYSTYKFDTTGFEYANYSSSLGADARSFELIEEKETAMTPAQEAGFVIGNKYTPKAGYSNKGKVFTFSEDDGTSIPQFQTDNGETFPEGWL